MRSGDIAECCSLMSKCHAEARQILRRSPNRSSHRQNGIYHKFQSLLCVFFIFVINEMHVYCTKSEKCHRIIIALPLQCLSTAPFS